MVLRGYVGIAPQFCLNSFDLVLGGVALIDGRIEFVVGSIELFFRDGFSGDQIFVPHVFRLTVSDALFGLCQARLFLQILGAHAVNVVAHAIQVRLGAHCGNLKGLRV